MFEIIGLSVNLLLLHALAHICFPRARRRTTDFFQLSYNVPNSQSYRQGSADFAFVAYWIVIFTGLRAAVMNYILLPIATWFGIEKNKSKVRFAEQAWLLVYYSIFWSYGMVSHFSLSGRTLANLFSSTLCITQNIG